MATIKLYTDLEQSKKLAEILPIESADMEYMFLKENGSKVSNIPFVKDDEEPKWPNDSAYDFIPCWSLAALLDVIPKEVKIKGQRYAPCLFPITDGHWLYRLWYNSNEIIESPISVWCDNPIDACYEMIIKLYEQNLL